MIHECPECGANVTEHPNTFECGSTHSGRVGKDGWPQDFRQSGECVERSRTRPKSEASASPQLVKPTYFLSVQDETELQRNFTYHPPQQGQPQRYERLRDEGKSLARRILEECPPSRERSEALTNLEQAIFWANVAIARNESVVL